MAKYFITQAGAGAHNGSSYANSDSVDHHNSATYQPDDIIYLCDTITDTIGFQASGTSGHPIVYRGDYAGHAGIIDVGFAENQAVYCAKSYLSFVNITFKNASQNLIQFTAAADYNIVTGCTFTNDSSHAGTFHAIYCESGSDGHTFSNNLIHDITSSNNTASGIWLEDCDNITISNNNIYNLFGGSDNSDCRGINTEDGGGHIITANTVHDVGINDGACLEMYGTTSCTISGNDFSLSHSCIEAKEGSNNNTFYNNYLHDPKTTGEIMSLGLNSAVESIGNLFYNNTFSSLDASSNISLVHLNSTGNTFKNNIFITTSTLCYLIYFDDMGAAVGNYGTFSNNCYFTAHASNYIINDADHTTEYALAGWQSASSQDSNSIYTDPLLSGFVLLPGSPCIRAGLTIDEVIHDIDGYMRPGRPGNKYSIGCCEYLGTNDPDHGERCRLPYR